mmetsp:Transcript_30828/g.101986  ORF Transcript_30828/g.101986 Transcript_30828/m.101986 type:complete len:396 (+) Transcript_30828:74-1261(+)
MPTLLLTLFISCIRASVLPKSAQPTAAGSTYRALVAGSVGEQFRDVAKIAEVALKELAEDEVLVKVVYAGVNGGCETFRARGEFAFASNRESDSGFALGAEGVGVVAAIGSAVEGFAEGDAVCFVGSGFAEYTTAKARTLWRVPEPTAEMAALRISGLTACAMMEVTGQVKAGETVLVTAAAGGAGHFAVQFAKLAGCTVVGTCSSEEKARALCALGCDHIINYKTRDVGEALARLAPGGIDVVFEGVGGRMLQTALAHLKEDGRLLQVAPRDTALPRTRACPRATRAVPRWATSASTPTTPIGPPRLRRTTSRRAPSFGRRRRSSAASRPSMATHGPRTLPPSPGASSACWICTRAASWRRSWTRSARSPAWRASPTLSSTCSRERRWGRSSFA